MYPSFRYNSPFQKLIFSLTRVSLTDKVTIGCFGHDSVVCESFWTNYIEWKPFMMARVMKKLSFCGPIDLVWIVKSTIGREFDAI